MKEMTQKVSQDKREGDGPRNPERLYDIWRRRKQRTLAKERGRENNIAFEVLEPEHLSTFLIDYILSLLTYLLYFQKNARVHS